LAAKRLIPLSLETRRRVDALFEGPARESAAELLITQYREGFVLIVAALPRSLCGDR